MQQLLHAVILNKCLHHRSYKLLGKEENVHQYTLSTQYSTRFGSRPDKFHNKKRNAG